MRGRRRHRDDAHCDAAVLGERELLLRVERERDLGARGDDHRARRLAQSHLGGLGEDIGAARDGGEPALGAAAIERGLGGIRQVLSRQQQRGRAVAVLDRRTPGDEGLDGVARTPDVEVGDQPQ